VRLLETVTTPTETRYRLPHERLIPALHRLTGKILAEVDQAKLKFEKAFLAWQGNDKQSHYVLKGKDLKLVERFVSQIPWGSNAQEKKTFLQQSKRRRTFLRGVTAAAVLTLFGAGWGASLVYREYENKRYLRESGYPPELYAYQHQLKKLELTEPLDLERFTWLHSDSIEELTIKAAESSNSIAGLASLARCRSLKKLSLDVGGSQVSEIDALKELKGLTHLTLNLEKSKVREVEALRELKNLTQLILSDSQERNIDALMELPGVTQLALDLSDSQVEAIKELKNLTRLSLKLNEVDKGTFFRRLTLDEQRELVSGDDGLRLDIPKGIQGLTQFTLDLSLSDVISIEALKELKGLTQLSLKLSDSQVSNVEVLKELPNLQKLSLTGLTRAQRMSFQQLPSRISELAF
jgi:ribosomal protein L7/L12